MAFLIFNILFLHTADARNKLKTYNGKISLPGKKNKQKILARNQLKSRHLY